MSVTSYANRQEFLYGSPEVVHSSGRAQGCKRQAIGKLELSHTSFGSVKEFRSWSNA